MKRLTILSGSVLTVVIGATWLSAGQMMAAKSPTTSPLGHTSNAVTPPGHKWSNATPEQDLPNVTLNGPRQGQVIDDETPDIKGWTQGRLAYAFAGGKSFGPYIIQCYLVIRNLEAPASEIGSAASRALTTYPLRVSNGFALRPQFSPDGRYVLLHIGEEVSDYGSYRPFVFDTQTEQLRRVTSRELSVRHICWSPDSRSIAYVEGGDALGNVSEFAHGPLNLIVCDWKSGHETIVRTDANMEVDSFCWLDAHTLLYGDFYQEPPAKLKQAGKKSAPQLFHAAIYAYDTVTHKTRIFLRDARDPVVSRTGQEIAFFGPEDLAHPDVSQDDSESVANNALSVIHRDSSQRTMLTVEEGGRPPFIAWRSDRSFLVVQQLQESPHAKAEIREWDTITQAHKLITTVTAEDYTYLPRRVEEPQFYPLGLSKDEKTLYLVKDQYTGMSQGLLNLVDTIQAVNLTTGNLSTITTLDGSTQFDWSNVSPVTQQGQK